ncbi:MAG: dephospho-CoA kinase [Gammaproteobacteria bacterium]|nr:dephospho-CoA kinase [Gammaproteobacteria bacterium]
MFTVGLTGGVAAGKSTATNFFIGKDIAVIDADVISRNLQLKGEAGYSKIVEKFSSDILDANNEIDRKKIRAIAFSDPNNKKWLEELMHPMIKDEVIKQFEEAKSSWAIYSAPLWSDKNIFNRTLVIDAPIAVQLERIIKRDGCTEQVAQQMIENQISSQERNCYASDLIINDASLEVFQNKLEFYYKLYNDLANE